MHVCYLFFLQLVPIKLNFPEKVVTFHRFCRSCCASAAFSNIWKCVRKKWQKNTVGLVYHNLLWFQITEVSVNFSQISKVQHHDHLLGHQPRRTAVLCSSSQHLDWFTTAGEQFVAFISCNDVALHYTHYDYYYSYKL